MTGAAPEPQPGPVVAGISLVWHTLVPGRPPHGLGLFVPRNPNQILEDFDEEEFFATDERMPYFATLWESAELLAGAVMDGPELAGMRVLDLGCGIGAVGLAAARRGARVTFLDWEPRAIDILRLSAAALGVGIEAAVAADWRAPPPLPCFDRVLAADVLYEERNLPGVAQFLADHLEPDGVAWITDPERKHAAALPEVARGVGLTAWKDPLRQGSRAVDLWKVRRKRPPTP